MPASDIFSYLFRLCVQLCVTSSRDTGRFYTVGTVIAFLATLARVHTGTANCSLLAQLTPFIAFSLSISHGFLSFGLHKLNLHKICPLSGPLLKHSTDPSIHQTALLHHNLIFWPSGQLSVFNINDIAFRYYHLRYQPRLPVFEQERKAIPLLLHTNGACNLCQSAPWALG